MILLFLSCYRRLTLLVKNMTSRKWEMGLILGIPEQGNALYG